MKSAASFDPGPLLAHLETVSLHRDDNPAPCGVAYGQPKVLTMAKAAGVSPKTLHRWRGGGRVGWQVADRCALALGLHPVLLWPDDWPAYDEDELAELELEL